MRERISKQREEQALSDVSGGLAATERTQKRTHHCEVGRSCGRGQQAIGRHAGVIPRVLWDETGDKESSVDHDLHSRLQRP